MKSQSYVGIVPTITYLYSYIGSIIQLYKLFMTLKMFTENIIHDGIQFQSVKLNNLIHDSKTYIMKNPFEELMKNGHVKIFEKNITKMNVNDKIKS